MGEQAQGLTDRMCHLDPVPSRMKTEPVNVRGHKLILSNNYVIESKTPISSQVIFTRGYAFEQRKSVLVRFQWFFTLTNFLDSILCACFRDERHSRPKDTGNKIDISKPTVVLISAAGQQSSGGCTRGCTLGTCCKPSIMGMLINQFQGLPPQHQWFGVTL